MTLQQQLLSYYKENTEDFNKDIEELDDWNGYLCDDRVIPMEELLDDYYQDVDPLTLLRRAFYGYDEDDSTLEKKAPFNPNRNYFYVNGLGNLVSTDQQDYSKYLGEDFVEEIIKSASDLTLSPGTQEIIEDYEEENDGENEMEVKLTADEAGIDQNDVVGTLDLFYTLVEDESFEKFGEELSKAGKLEFSDENGYDPDEVEDWFFNNSRVIEWKGRAKEFYNQIIGRNDIKVKILETREVIVNGIKFTVSATASKSEMFNNREAQKLFGLKIW